MALAQLINIAEFVNQVCVTFPLQSSVISEVVVTSVRIVFVFAVGLIQNESVLTPEIEAILIQLLLPLNTHACFW